MTQHSNDTPAQRHVITTEDGAELEPGARAFNYYDRKPGTIVAVDTYTQQGDRWFEFHHDKGDSCYLNGARICSVAYAIRRGWMS